MEKYGNYYQIEKDIGINLIILFNIYEKLKQSEVCFFKPDDNDNCKIIEKCIKNCFVDMDVENRKFTLYGCNPAFVLYLPFSGYNKWWSLDRRILNLGKITLEEFWKSKEHLAIHCDTEEKVIKLLRAFDKMGKKWWTGESYLLENHWECDEREVCYSNQGTCAEKSNFGLKDYTIYEFEDVLLEEN